MTLLPAQGLFTNKGRRFFMLYFTNSMSGARETAAGAARGTERENRAAFAAAVE
jgi:hypothetical protein